MPQNMQVRENLPLHRQLFDSEKEAGNSCVLELYWLINKVTWPSAVNFPNHC